MVEILVILDGATDTTPSSLDEADTPALSRLAAEGETEWLELLDPGVPVGSETAIASLLGWRPPGPVDRARVEAAARGLPEGPVRRVDLAGGHRLLVFGEATRVEAEAITRVWPAGERPPRILDERTVVVGAPGAATRDRAAKIAVLEQADRDLISLLADEVKQRGGRLAVGPDHGCDPATGEHVGGPVQLVRWSAA